MWQFRVAYVLESLVINQGRQAISFYNIVAWGLWCLILSSGNDPNLILHRGAKLGKKGDITPFKIRVYTTKAVHVKRVRTKYIEFGTFASQKIRKKDK